MDQYPGIPPPNVVLCPSAAVRDCKTQPGFDVWKANARYLRASMLAPLSLLAACSSEAQLACRDIEDASGRTLFSRTLYGLVRLPTTGQLHLTEHG